MTLSIRNLKLEPDIKIPDAEAQFRPKVETQRRDDLQYSSLVFFSRPPGQHDEKTRSYLMDVLLVMVCSLQQQAFPIK